MGSVATESSHPTWRGSSYIVSWFAMILRGKPAVFYLKKEKKKRKENRETQTFMLDTQNMKYLNPN